MAISFHKIPIDNTIGAQNLSVTLKGKTFVLFIRWNIRNQSWYMDLRKSDNTALVTGIKLVPMYSLLKAYSDGGAVDFPDGQFVLMAADPTVPIDRDNLGTDWSMFFIGN